jgi:riboflavin kinase/FMN adenylyltransferase
MDLVVHLARVGAAMRPRALAIGRFDGVHRGHRRLLSRLRDVASERRGEAVVALLAVPREAAGLTTLRQRLALLDAEGVDRVVLLGHRDPRHAAQVAARLAPAALVSGQRVEGVGCPVLQVDAERSDGIVISAEAVCERLLRGDLDGAERALGRHHAVEGRVVHGFHRGAPLGIPTANLRVRGLVLPPDGVYVVRARVGGRALDGVANVGRNPTFGNLTRSVETHLFDFADDIYGSRLEVAFVAGLRRERKFPGVEALVAQIHADISAARALLADRGNGR